jgi:hypothetical protein
MRILIDTKAGSFTISDLPAISIPWGYCAHLPANVLEDRVKVEFNKFQAALEKSVVAD